MSEHKTIRELKEKLDMVFQAYVTTENTLQGEIRQIPWGKIPEADAQNAYNYLEYMLANITRQSFLIMVCSWLEVTMDVIGEASIPDYVQNCNDKKGSWFDKRVAVFNEYCKAFENMGEERQFIENVRRIRNCIVHAGGRVEKYRYSDQVKEAVKWLFHKAKKSNENYVEVRNGLLYLGDQIIAEMVIVSEEIIEHL